MGDLDGQVALITGAGAGLGAEYARGLAREGARIVLNDLECDWFGREGMIGRATAVAESIIAAGGEVVLDPGDCGSWDDAEAMVERAVSTFGKLDVLVCNAGIMRLGPVATLSRTDWDDVLHVHLDGTFAPAHFAAEHWYERAARGEDLSACRVVTTTSAAAICFSPNAAADGWWSAAYAAAKAGVIGFTIALAGELSDLGIGVNAVLPGSWTHGRRPGTEDDASLAARMVPERVAPIVCALASPRLTVTGRVFHAIGGRLDAISLPRLVPGQFSDRGRTVEDALGELGAFGAELAPYSLETYHPTMMAPIHYAAGRPPHDDGK